MAQTLSLASVQHLCPVLIPKVTAWTKRQTTEQSWLSSSLGLLLIIELCRTSTAMSSYICPLFLLLFLPSTAHSEGFSTGPIELAPVPCNDKIVEKLSRLAVTYINEDREEGYKFALNRVANVHLHAQVGTKRQSPMFGAAAWGCFIFLSVGCLYTFNRGSGV